MSAFSQKWTQRTAELHLPRPRTIKVPGPDSGPAVKAVLAGYADATKNLADISEHMVTRWKSVGGYSESLGTYAQVLATHVSTVDSAFLGQITSTSEAERRDKIEALLATKSTRSHGQAAALIYPTYFAALAVGLTAFAVKDNSRKAFGDAEVALRSVEGFYVDFEQIAGDV